MEENDLVELGKRLAKAREAKRLKQAAAAYAVDVTEGTLSRIELGKQTPGTDVLVALAKLYDVGTDDLLGLGREPEGTRLELEEHPAITRFEEDEGRPVSSRGKELLRAIARSDGPDAITNEVVHRIEDAAKAVDRGTKMRRPRDVENVIDESKGERRAVTEPATGPRLASKRDERPREHPSHTARREMKNRKR